MMYIIFTYALEKYFKRKKPLKYKKHIFMARRGIPRSTG
jgi:hypothetical protein